MDSFSSEYGFKVVGPDGTVYWLSAARVTNVGTCINSETSAAMAVGEAIKAGAVANLTMLPQTGLTIRVNEGIKGLRVAAAADINWLGVCINGAAAGKVATYAGFGSIICVKSMAITTGHVNTIGAAVIGSATAGAVGSLTANAAGNATNTAAGGTILGRIVLPAAATLGDASTTGVPLYTGIIVGHP
jgi:hypothetical protein